MHTMLIRPTKQELLDFGKTDFLIYNAGAFPANRLTAGVESRISICLSLEGSELIILGTEYAGEMKKGVFTVANYFAPQRGLLSMHCSATADRQIGPVITALRTLRYGQDHPLCRSETGSHRRRRACVER